MGLFGLDNNFLVLISLIVILISIITIVVCVVFVLRRKSVEEKHADKVLASLSLLKEGKSLPSSAPQTAAKVSPSPKSGQVLEIKKEENSLKHLLIKKFKPIVEKQLGAKTEFLDFNAKEENFLALVVISGVRILLTLDSSGKILDYKKVKQKD